MGVVSSKAVDVSPMPVVVIVGGGYAGVALAKALDRDFFVVLIDRKDYKTHNVALPRAVVEPQRAPDMLVTYERLLRNGVFVQATVASITPKEVHLAGLSSPLTGFDYLVIALGSSYNLPARVGAAQRVEQLPSFEAQHAALRSASRVLIVGAGPVGVELSAEIATDFPTKHVTLVSANDYLAIPGLLPKLYSAVETKLLSLGVDVVKNERIVIPPDLSSRLAATDLLYHAETRAYQSSTGRSFETDLAFFTVGSLLNQSALTASSAWAQQLTAKGELKVNAHLQVEGHSNVFAIGDISAREPLKLAFRAGEQSKWLAKAFLTIHSQGGKTSGVKPYAPPPPAIGMSLGRHAGAGQYDKSLLPSWLMSFLKSKHMGVKQHAQTLNVRLGEGRVALTEQQNAERASKLVNKLKLSQQEAAALVSGLRVAHVHNGAVDHV